MGSRKGEVTLIDVRTGEVLDEVPVVFSKRVGNGFGGWMAQSLEAAKRLGQLRKELGAEGYSVLWGLLAKLDYQNLIVVSQAELGRELGLHPANVQRAIKKLIGARIIEEGPRVGIHRSFKLSPELGWRGSGIDHRQALEKHQLKLLTLEGGKK